ncbi:MAG: cation-translocating P-type ATPase [Spirochaetia bacterium]|nr:cation-translocating P-type ATPase [Spirochaetota bacterium]MDW8111996.1 cation-translocating P-type ATPase [Spirochaetia bacterium]
MIDLRFQISGMSCTSCARTVEKIILTSPDVYKVKVDFTTAVAHISAKTSINLSDIRRKLKDFGYDLAPLEDNVRLDVERRRVFLAFFLSLPLFIFMVLKMFGIHIHNTLLEVLTFVLSASVVIVVGFRIHKNGIRSLLYLSPNTDSLVSIGSLSALLTFFLNKVFQIGDFSVEAVIVMDVFILGNYIKTKLSESAVRSLKELYKIFSNHATIIEDGKEVKKDIGEVREGNIVVIKSGERIPIDGVVIEGKSSIEESFITGEAKPRVVERGDKVFAGGYNIDGFLKVRVNKKIEDTLLYKTIQLVEDIKYSKLPIQNIADAFVKYLVPVVLFVSLFSLIFWISIGDLNRGIVSFVSVLVIACPCALGIAIPTALAVAIGILSKKGIIIRNFEKVRLFKRVDTFIFDKTGTLTVGKPRVVEISLDSRYARNIFYLSSLSEHPLSIALKDYLKDNFADVSEETSQVDQFKVLPGEGIEGIVDGKRFKIQRSKEEDKTTSSDIFLFDSNEWHKIGKVYFSDTLKEEARDIIEYLKTYGKIIMLTGDKCSVAEDISNKTGIEEYYCSLLPHQKLEIVKNIQNQGRIVMYVGDGINDTPSLSASDIGVVFSSKDNIVASIGDFVITSKNLKDLKFLIDFSRTLDRKIIQNLVWAFVYNLIAIPVAFIGLLTPSIAEVLMALSSISVVLNSLTLRGRSKSLD